MPESTTIPSVTLTPRTGATRVPGHASEIIRAYGGRLRVADFYDSIGSPVYDALTRTDRSEVTELVKHMRRGSGPILELACGSGRLTLPLLSCGREVIAVDNSPTMLTLLRERLDTPAGRRIAPRLTTLLADMTTVDTGGPVGSVVLGTTSISLLDRERRRSLFQHVAASLQPNGKFVFSTLQFDNAPRPESTETLRVFVTDGALHVFMEYVDHSTAQRWVSVLRQPSGGEPTLITTSTRVLDVGTLTGELAEAGLELVECQTINVADARDGHSCTPTDPVATRRTLLITSRLAGRSQ